MSEDQKTTNPPVSSNTSGDTLTAFAQLLARQNNDGGALARQLYDENEKQRQRIAQLEKQVPAEGTVVLSAEQAKAWQTYQELGAADEVAKRLGEATALQRDLQLRDVASASGFNLDVLKRLAGDLAFEIKEEQVEGKAVKVPFVKTGDQVVKLADYASGEWAAFMPALQPQQAPQVPQVPQVPATNPLPARGSNTVPATPVAPANVASLVDISWKM